MIFTIDSQIDVKLFWGKHCYTYTTMFHADTNLSYDVSSGSDITPFIEINKLLVVYKFSNVTE